MRPALREFLSTLEKAYSVHVNYLNSQLASFEYPFTSFKYPEDVIHLLYELTLHIEEPSYYQSKAWENQLGLGVGIVGDRFERIFGKDLLSAYERARTGVDGGIRDVVEKFFRGYCDESVRGILLPIIHTFFEAEYGWFPEYDFKKSQEDGLAYFKAHKDVLPSNIGEQAKTLLFGTKIGKPKSMHSFLYEMYLLHPKLAS